MFSDPTESFWAKVDKNGPVPETRPDLDACWLWTGAIISSGYGMLFRVLAHRFAHELLVGPIPDGHEVDHLCFVRACVNPAHLEAVTQAENKRRSVIRREARRKAA